MLRTASFVFDICKAVVEAHETFNNFITVFTKQKDEPTEKDYPAVIFTQWTADIQTGGDFGPQRRQLVRLELVESISTDRTTDEMTASVNRADDAASEIATALATYDKLGIENIQISAFADNAKQNETGVLMQFVVNTQLGATCYEPAFPNGLPDAPTT